MSTTYSVIYSPQAFLDLTELYESFALHYKFQKQRKNKSTALSILYVLLRLCLCDIHLLA